MKKLLILSLLGFSCALGAMDTKPSKSCPSSQTNSTQAQQAEKTCPICLDKLGTEGGVEALACGDVFCSACIQRAMSPSNATCPCCRKTKEQLAQLSRGQIPTPTPTRRRRQAAPPITLPSAQEILPLLVVVETFFNNVSNSVPQSGVLQNSRNLARTARQAGDFLARVNQIVEGNNQLVVIGQFFNNLFNN